MKNINPERLKKIVLYVISDIIFIDFSIAVAMSLWFDGSIPGGSFTVISQSILYWYGHMAIVAPIIAVAIYALMKMYSNLWKYASIDEMLKIFVATTIIFILLYFYDVFYLSQKDFMILPRRLLFVAWSINIILFTFSRFGYRMIKRIFIFISHVISSKSGLKRVMIVGAGFSAYNLIRQMQNSYVRDKLPIIVIDDDVKKNNSNILGVRVLAGMDNIVDLVDRYKIDEIILTEQNDMSKMQMLMRQCTKTDCTLKIIPHISDVSDNINFVPNLRNVNISDLLCRDEIKLDTKNISDYICNRTVLVTGGGGSIGSELCRQIIKFNPQLLIIFDIYENNAFELVNELRAKYKHELNIVIKIGSITDVNCLEKLFSEYKIHVVFHAAAHKHVVLMENSADEAVKNNIFGTLNVAKCADKFKVERFILLSTDKAVNPSNVMGATKRICELIVQYMAQISKTKFIAVRFGNVLGSNGSVIPIFQQQIISGGPVTVTHPDVVRYFMTIPEAAQLVLQATSLGKSGKIFVLDMGSPVNINELAINLIKLSGLHPNKDIQIVYTGLRMGEKLSEELILAEEKENLQKTCHNKIFVANAIEFDYEKFAQQLKKLLSLINDSPDKVDKYLHKILPNYKKITE